MWLSGVSVGQRDPDLLAAAPYRVANLVTLMMDAAVIGLAWALTDGWVKRIPAVALLVPMWVADGLLAPVAVIVPLAAPFVVSAGVGDTSDALRLWVYVLVYASLISQAVLLNIAFVAHLRRRRLTQPQSLQSVPSPPGQPACGRSLQFIGGVAVGAASLSAGTSWYLVLSLGPGPADPIEQIAVGVRATWLIVAAVALLCLLYRGGTSDTRLSGILWLGTAAPITWSAYDLAVAGVMGVTHLISVPGLAAQLLAAAFLGAVTLAIQHSVTMRHGEGGHSTSRPR